MQCGDGHAEQRSRCGSFEALPEPADGRSSWSTVRHLSQRDRVIPRRIVEVAKADGAEEGSVG